MTLFGNSKKPDVKEQARQMKRDITKEKRGVDRDISAMERDEAKILNDIKTAAKKGDTKLTTILAKQLLNLRKTKGRLQETNSRLGGIQAQATNMAATAKLGDAMKNTAGIMSQVNAQINLPEFQNTMQQMQQEQAKASLKDEMIADVFDMMDPDDIEEEMDGEVNKVLEELALDARGKIPALSRIDATSSADADIEKRLAQLGI